MTATIEPDATRLDRDPGLDQLCPPRRKDDDKLYAAWVLNVVKVLPSRDFYVTEAEKDSWDACMAEGRKVHAWITAIGAVVEHDEHGKAVITVPVDERPVRPAAPIRLISARVARRLLREVVAAYGKHHSIGKNPCAYIDHSGQIPLCLVGCALYLAGLSENDLFALDRADPTEIDLVRFPARVRITRAARRVLKAAQVAQDDTGQRSGLPWGAALDSALALRPYWRTAVSA